MSAVASLLAAVEIGPPLTRGSLALFPLFNERPSDLRYLSGPRAGTSMHVSELAGGAQVRALTVANTADVPLLLIDGETLVGGRQNRIVTVSVLVAPSASVNVSVTCVEQGRWGAERPMARSDRHAPSGVRARNRTHVAAEAGRGAPPQADQAGVWEEVGLYSRRVGASSPTGAMEDVHLHAADRVHNLVGATRPLLGQCGVAVAVGGRVVAADLFDRPETLADYWAPLVAGYALDADALPANPPRRRRVRAVLAEVAAATPVPSGDVVHLRADGVTASALVHDGAVVHLALSASKARPTPRRWFTG